MNTNMCRTLDTHSIRSVGATEFKPMYFEIELQVSTKINKVQIQSMSIPIVLILKHRAKMKQTNS
jgi:hypothetical protein